jgi:hypothetical protein
MSSLRRIQSSKANGARSRGPSTPEGKQRAKLNAIRHGLCARCLVMDDESRDNFLILLQQHIDRFRPSDEVEFGMIEEMCAAYWRQRRAWAIETGLFNKQMATQPDENTIERMVTAFDNLAASHSLSLVQRYETRQHQMYQRSLRTLILLRTIEQQARDLPDGDMPNEDLPNEPSPISGHPGDPRESPPEPFEVDDSEALPPHPEPVPEPQPRPPASADASVPRPSSPAQPFSHPPRRESALRPVPHGYPEDPLEPE